MRLQAEQRLRVDLCNIRQIRSMMVKYNADIQVTGGEGGIRTLGPPQEGQRFSRPPRSTAPAPLLADGGNGLAGRQRERKRTGAQHLHPTGPKTTLLNA